jgi:Pyruvate/2-oxoacid:ferredoxin oxidoreductase delta subunit
VTVEHLAIQPDGSLQPTGVFETLPLDALVLALGQHADARFLQGVSGITMTQDSSIQVDQQLMTGRAGVFAGGDAIGGPRTMTAATGHGKKAARAIDAWLAGKPLELRTKPPSVDFAMLHLPLFLDADRAPASELPVEARNGFAEVIAGIDADQARREADRCLSCGNCFECDNCLAACPEQAVLKLGTGAKYSVALELCTGCAVCFEQCPCHAIEMLPEPPTDARLQPAQFKPRP